MSVHDRDAKVGKLLLEFKLNLLKLGKDLNADQVRQVLGNQLLELSKCPDFVVNRGHYFGTSYFKQEPGLSDDDKRALIELLKTF